MGTHKEFSIAGDIDRSTSANKCALERDVITVTSGNMFIFRDIIGCFAVSFSFLLCLGSAL